MATLLLDRDGVCTERRFATTCSLRAWLKGAWGLLFSHPDDFAQYDIEADRWLVLLHDAFAEAHVRPIAVGSAASSAGASGWLAHVNAALADPHAVSAADLPIFSRTRCATRSSAAAARLRDDDRQSRYIIYTSVPVHRLHG